MSKTLKDIWMCTSVQDILIHYVGVDICWYLKDESTLKRVWKHEDKRMGLVEGITSTQGYKYLIKVCGVDKPYEYIGDTFIESLPLRNPGLTVVLLAQHCKKYPGFDDIIRGIECYFNIDIHSKDINIRRLSKLICMVGEHRVFNPDSYKLHSFMINMPRYEYFKRLMYDDQSDLESEHLLPPTKKNIEYLVRYLIERTLDEKFISDEDDNRIYYTYKCMEGYVQVWGRSTLMSIFDEAKRVGNECIVEMVTGYIKNKPPPRMLYNGTYTDD